MNIRTTTVTAITSDGMAETYDMVIEPGIKDTVSCHGCPSIIVISKAVIKICSFLGRSKGADAEHLCQNFLAGREIPGNPNGRDRNNNYCPHLMGPQEDMEAKW